MEFTDLVRAHRAGIRRSRLLRIGVDTRLVARKPYFVIVRNRNRADQANILIFITSGNYLLISKHLHDNYYRTITFLYGLWIKIRCNTARFNLLKNSANWSALTENSES